MTHTLHIESYYTCDVQNSNRLFSFEFLMKTTTKNLSLEFSMIFSFNLTFDSWNVVILKIKVEKV